MPADPLVELTDRLRRFAAERDRLTPEGAATVMSSPRAEDGRDEPADVLLHLVRLADVLGVDLADVASDKLDRIEKGLPVGEVRSRADHRPGAGQREAGEDSGPAGCAMRAPSPLAGNIGPCSASRRWVALGSGSRPAPGGAVLAVPHGAR